MKKIIFLLLIPFLTFSQTTEKDQKKAVVQQRSQNNSSMGSLESSQKRVELYGNSQRYQLPRNNVYYPFHQGRTIIPYGYFGYPWSRYYWYDDWGFRNYSRIYVLPSGTQDTIKMKPIHGSFGIQTTGQDWGVFLSLGRKVYFLFEYQTSIQRDRSTYYSQLTYDQVQSWNDNRLEDIRDTHVFYFGIGKRFKKTGIHSLIGFASDSRRFQFEDELKILAANGKYSIPGYEDKYVTFKMGASRNVGPVLLKLDYDVAGRQISGGIGINF